MTTALIDADSIVYRCGFAGETISTILYYEQFGEKKQQPFTSTEKESAAEQIDFFLRSLEGAAEELDRVRHVNPDPLENVLHSVKLNIEGVLTDTGSADYQIFLTGKTNYRDAIAKQRPYKGNRDKLHRPFWYKEIRQYLIDRWGAKVIEGEEADDAISILARTPEHLWKSVVCSIDKDLDQIPGKHFDFMKKVSYDVHEEQAEFVFYRQCLSGDSVDNIPGCYKMGIAKATSLLEDTAWLDYWDAIVKAYEASQLKPGCPYVGQDPEAVALETAQLVRLRTFEGEIWQP